jgi:hypothetical protein
MSQTLLYPPPPPNPFSLFVIPFECANIIRITHNVESKYKEKFVNLKSTFHITTLKSAISNHVCSLTDMDCDYIFGLKLALIKSTPEIINFIYNKISGTD